MLHIRGSIMLGNAKRQVKKGYSTLLQEAVMKPGPLVVLGQQYPLITGQTDFVKLDQPMIHSAQGSAVFYGDIIDPGSLLLKAHYITLLEVILRERASSPTAMINEVMAYCKQILPKGRRDNPLDLSKVKIEEEISVGGEWRPITMRVVNIDEFIRTQQGVCRHHSVIAGYFLGRLVQSKLLPVYEVRIHRDQIKNRSHAVIMLINEEETILVDTYNFKEPVIMRNNKEVKADEVAHHARVEKGFGEGYLAAAHKRFRM
jgi:hypothetical protein